MNKMKSAGKAFFLLSSVLLFPVSVHASTLTYTVEQGDTLTKIAKKYQTTVNDLVALNQLSSDKLSVGQALLVSSAHAAGEADSQPQDLSTLQNGEVSEQSNLNTGDDSAATSHQDASGKAIVNADSLNVRDTPSLTGAILTKLSAGTLVEIIEKGPEWTKIRLGDREAFVASVFLSTPAELPAAFSSDSGNGDFSGKLFDIIQPLLKTRYVLGGTTPDGFDCSGFTSYVYQQFGITLPRTSEEQFSVGQEVSLEQAQPGDLLFYDSLKKGHISHVAIYAGGGMIVHANGEEVKYEKVANMHKLYPFYGVKRLFPSASPSK